MSEKKKSYQNKNNPIATLIALAFTIVLEKLISPSLERILAWIASKGFKLTDYLYLRIAENFMVNIPFYIFVLLAISLSIQIAQRKKSRNEKIKEMHDKKISKLKVLEIICELIYRVRRQIEKIPTWAFLLVFWLVISFFLTTVNYINHSIIRINNNIDIVSEYIDDAQCKHLKTTFLKMKGYDDYLELIYQIEKIADENDIELQN